MGKPDDSGIVDVDIALVDSRGEELADGGADRIVITKESVEEANRLLGIDKDPEPSEEELEKIYEKMKGSNRGIKVTRADGTTFTT